MKEGDNKTEARYTVEAYYKGFRLLLTLPFENGGAIVGILDKMSEMGFTGERTIHQVPTAETSGNGGAKEIESHICPIHNIAMKKFEKNGQVWYSHKTSEGWCSGKAKK